MVGVKSFRNVGQKRFVGTDGLLRFSSVCICFGKAVAGSNRGGVPAAKSPNLIAEKRLIHGNCLERASRLRFWKVLFGISCRFVCAGSGRFASAEFVCIRCSRPVKGRLGPIRWRRCAGAHRRGSAPSHRLFGRFPARLKRTQSSQRRRVQCAHQNSDRPGATNRSIVLC